MQTRPGAHGAGSGLPGIIRAGAPDDAALMRGLSRHQVLVKER